MSNLIVNFLGHLLLQTSNIKFEHIGTYIFILGLLLIRTICKHPINDQFSSLKHGEIDVFREERTKGAYVERKRERKDKPAFQKGRQKEREEEKWQK